ncbi:diguanylate cyclase [Chelativorans sp. ZYF759]|nr:diguanylate cyclase [Chelativorans sp. ZYF759]
MWGVGDVLMRRLETMSVLRQTTLMVGAALMGANALTLLFYSIFFEDRLLLDLFFTTVIVIVLGYPLGYLFIGQNVRLRTVAAELDRVSRMDELTNLANRRCFMHKTESLLRESSGGGALLYIDVDNFKQLNDAHGHAVGDRVLRSLGALISANVGKDAVAARIGGEEFTVFMPGADIWAAQSLAEKIRRRVREMALSDLPEVVQFTVSIGIAVRKPGQGLETLMNEADTHLYGAKRAGRDRVVCALPGAA